METQNKELKREIGVSGLTATVVNFTIGAGIFVLPALVGIQLGSYSIFGYLFCSFMLGTIMLCYSEIGKSITSTGGSYAYVEQVLGPLPGFIVNCLVFFGWGVLGSAALMNILTDALVSLIPAINGFWWRIFVLFTLLTSFCYINIAGVRQGVNFVKIITIIKLTPLICIIIFGFSHINMDHFDFNQWPSFQNFGEAVLILFFAFAGFETSLSMSGEFRSPERTIPRGLLFGALVILIVYLLLQTLVLGVLGDQLVHFKDAPLAAVANSIFGSTGYLLILLATAISCFGTVCGDVMATARILYAASKDEYFPKFLSQVHPRYYTPHRAILVYALLIFIFAASGGFKQMAIMASCAILLIYLSVIIALVFMRLRSGEIKPIGTSLPFKYAIPLFAVSCIFYLLFQLTAREILSTLIFILVVCIVYFIKENKYFRS